MIRYNQAKNEITTIRNFGSRRTEKRAAKVKEEMAEEKKKRMEIIDARAMPDSH